MKEFVFVGTVYYGAEKHVIQTTLTIQAPSLSIAKAVLRNYGMSSLKSVRQPQTSNR